MLVCVQKVSSEITQSSMFHCDYYNQVLDSLARGKQYNDYSNKILQENQHTMCDATTQKRTATLDSKLLTIYTHLKYNKTSHIK